MVNMINIIFVTDKILLIVFRQYIINLVRGMQKRIIFIDNKKGLKIMRD